MPKVILFDVNETMLDLRALDPHFARAFGDAGVRRVWFQQFVQNFLLTIVLDTYVEFGTVGRRALDMVAERLGTTITDDDRKRILATIRELPPYPEVGESLQRLRDAGFRLGTLTNSTKEVAEAQMRNADLIGLFEQLLSADEVKRLKPSAEPYRMAAGRFGVPINEVRLVAAHAWDVAGALRAGCKAAFVARPGMVLDSTYEPPDIVGRDLREVVAAILASETRV